MAPLCYFCWKEHEFEQKCEERFLAMVQRVEQLSKPKKKLRQLTLTQAWARTPKKGENNFEKLKN